MDNNEMENHIIVEHEGVLSSENVDSHDINHIISNFIDDTVCMICDHVCENKVEIIDHVKKEHLEIISQEDFDKTFGSETSETQRDEEPLSEFYHPRERLSEVYDQQVYKGKNYTLIDNVYGHDGFTYHKHK